MNEAKLLYHEGLPDTDANSRLYERFFMSELPVTQDLVNELADKIVGEVAKKNIKQEDTLIIYLARAHYELPPSLYSALAEAIKNKLNLSSKLQHLSYNKIFISKMRISDKKDRLWHPSEVLKIENLNRAVSVWRFSDLNSGTTRRKNDAMAALKILEKAQKKEPCAYVTEIKHRHSVAPEAVVAFLEDFTTLADLPDSLESLLFFEDTLRGAVYLEKQGLVLEDIKLDNLGVATTSKGRRGILFDLDGLGTGKEPYETRLAAEDYFPPEAVQKVGAELPTCVSAKEMVYQFGLCLIFLYSGTLGQRKWFYSRSVETVYTKKEKERQRISKLYENLIHMMTDKDPAKRPSLKECLARIEDINNILMLHTYPYEQDEQAKSA